MADYKEKGVLKPFTDRIRTGSKIVDWLPIPGFDDVAAAGLSAVAGALDTAACALKNDWQGAKREALKGIAETAVAAIPFIEYTSIIPGVNLRKSARAWVDRQIGSEFNAQATGASATEEPQPPAIATKAVKKPKDGIGLG